MIIIIYPHPNENLSSGNFSSNTVSHFILIISHKMKFEHSICGFFDVTGFYNGKCWLPRKSAHFGDNNLAVFNIERKKNLIAYWSQQKVMPLEQWK